MFTLIIEATPWSKNKKLFAHTKSFELYSEVFDSKADATRQVEMYLQDEGFCKKLVGNINPRYITFYIYQVDEVDKDPKILQTYRNTKKTEKVSLILKLVDFL